jgi:N-glycosylase/DNA lyase
MLDISARINFGNKLLDAFKKRKGIFSNQASASKNDIGMDRETYLNYIIFMSSMDYQKRVEADEIWKEGKKWVKKYPWLFKPKELLSKNIFEVIKVFEEIRKESPLIFRLKDIAIWLTIANTLYNEYKGETIVLLERFDYDAHKIYNKLKNEKKKFPFLSGEKILSMYLKILNEDGGINLKNIDKIPLPVDKNVAMATFNLIFHEEFKGKVDESIRKRVREVWNEIANKIGVPVIEFDTPL